MKLYHKLLYFLLLSVLFWAQKALAGEDNRSFTVINAANGLADNSAQVVKCTKTGRLIISTIGNLNFYDGKSFTHADTHTEYEYPLPLYNGHYHLYFDRNHHIWLKDKRKVTCLDLLTERFIPNVDSVLQAMGCKEKVLDLFCDKKGDIWFVTDKGLSSLKYGMTYPMMKGNLQDVDVAGNTILTFYDNGEVTAMDSLGNIVAQARAYPEEQQQEYSESSVLEPFGDGFFQIRNGKKEGILLYFDTKTMTFKTLLAPDYHLNNMTIDAAQKRLYVPSEYGYWTYDIESGATTHIPELQLTRGKTMGTDCNAMAFDHQGGLWIGTEKRGVLYARPHSLTFRSYPWGDKTADSLGTMMNTLGQNIEEHDGIKAYCQMTDSRGWLWIGTRKGLYLEQPGAKEAKKFTRKKGLNNEVIHSIIEDREHNIWAATSCGISFILVRGDSVVFINNFTSEDNVPNESFENGKAMLLKDGSIAMQAIEHVVVFNPKDLKEVNEPHVINNIKPKLTKILVNGNDVAPGVPFDDNIIVDRAMTRVREINLKSDQNSISLTFSALNYFRPMQTYYRVRVRELGNKWEEFSYHSSTNVDSRGMLHYPMMGLHPGTYHVEVQASMFPGVWEENIPDTQRFIWEVHVKQSWWRTTGLFALLGVILLALLIVNFFYYNRNTRMRDKLNNEEGDIIRKIVYFVENCNILATQPFTPVQDTGDDDDKRTKLSPEFVSLMQKLIPYVSTHQKALTMRKLSEVGGVHIVQLYEIVTGNLYKSPREYSRIVKLQKAAELLRTTDKSIEQIAQECGFYTPNYFLGNFFHEYKQTAKEFRDFR